MKNLENCLNPIKWPQNAKKKSGVYHGRTFTKVITYCSIMLLKMKFPNPFHQKKKTWLTHDKMIKSFNLC